IADCYQCLVPLEESDWDEFLLFDGRKLAASWRPLKMKYDVYDFGHRPISDFPGLAEQVPVFSERAAQELAELLERNGELLPLDCSGVTYFAYNVTTLVSALRSDLSEIERFESGRIMMVDRYVLRASNVRDKEIFKLKELPCTHGFVSQWFVDQVTKAKLSGFLFEPVECV